MKKSPETDKRTSVRFGQGLGDEWKIWLGLEVEVGG